MTIQQRFTDGLIYEIQVINAFFFFAYLKTSHQMSNSEAQVLEFLNLSYSDKFIAPMGHRQNVP